MKAKSEERRQHIMMTADAVFREMGFDAASMSIIAARVGGSKATLYNYFSTKEELFVEIMLAEAQKQGKEAFAIFAKEGSLREKLDRFGPAYLKFVTSDEIINVRRMMIAQAQRSDIGVQCYERGMKIGWGKVADAIATGIDLGEMQAGDPWIMAMHLKGLLEAGIADLCLLGVKIDKSTRRLNKAAALSLEVFFRAYGAGMKKPRPSGV
ncbi:MAG: putative transcription regulator protein TetR family [Alphaproteobacteria bacterium]|nr:putative transcription regulator protein TetR family [Alphaproteobacteria bacterium]